MVTLDIHKAFDFIRHNGLLYKLIQIITPTYLILLIKTYPQNKRFYCKIRDKTKEPHNIQHGVPHSPFRTPLLPNDLRFSKKS